MRQTLLRLLYIWLLFIIPTGAESQSIPQWRYWTSMDGMEESWSDNIEINQNGDVCIKHGDVEHWSRLDGYFTYRFLNPFLDTIKRSTRGMVIPYCYRLWTLYLLDQKVVGLQKYNQTEEQWMRYEIAEFHNMDIPLQTPLLPIDDNHMVHPVIGSIYKIRRRIY